MIDGNKRLALDGLIALLGINGRRLTLSNDDVYDLIIAVTPGEFDDVPTLAARIRAGSEDR